jgi:hypothetical protein
VQLAEKSASEEPGSKPSFTTDDASRTTDPAIRDQLTVYAEGREVEHSFEKESKRLQIEEDKFRALSQQSMRLGENIGSLAPPSDAGATDGKPRSGMQRGPAGAEAKLLDANVENQESQSAVTNSKDDPNSKDSTSKKISGAAPGSDIAASQTTSLRALLKKRMNKDKNEAEDKLDKKIDREALEGATFGKGLNPPPGFLRAGGGKEGKPFFADDVLAAAGARENAFSMRAEDSSAELTKLIQSAGWEAHDQAQAGLLGIDTASLFDRIRQAHRACLARDCVAGGR